MAEEKKNFAFETTLASRTFAPWIFQLKQKGYQFHLVFLWLESVELAILRVKERVKVGGHFVPEETVKRRYISGIKNFFKLYQPMADSWNFCDNSIFNRPIVIAAESRKNTLSIHNQILWNKIQELSQC